MRLRSTDARPAVWIIALLALAGCSPTMRAVDASGYAAMGCNELNDTVASVSKELSQTAITRGKVSNTNVPTWVPGGTRVRSAVTDRLSTRIDRLQEKERAVFSARDRTCARRE